MPGSKVPKSALKKEVQARILGAALPYIENWVRTLGIVGDIEAKLQFEDAKTGKKKTANLIVKVSEQVTAAGKGMDILMKALDGDLDSAVGDDLLKKLTEDGAYDLGESDDDTDTGLPSSDDDVPAGFRWSGDSKVPPQEADLVEGRLPDGGD